MALLRYISHPNVTIDPETSVPQWHLSSLGRQRLRKMLNQSWVRSIGRVVGSTETKAVEAAEMLAEHLELSAEWRARTGEIDRSATGFVPHDQHESLADRFFGDPDRSANGWETARAAQSRIVRATSDLVAGDDDYDVALVGHGGVGTLLLCHLAGLSIDRAHDQPGQGHHWAFDRSSGLVVHRWLPIEQ